MLREIEYLLEEPGITPETMLMSAVAKGHEAVVARLLRGGTVQVNFPDNSEGGATALVLAASLGKDKVSLSTGERKKVGKSCKAGLRQSQTEQLRTSKKKFLETRYQPLFSSLYSTLLPALKINMVKGCVNA